MIMRNLKKKEQDVSVQSLTEKMTPRFSNNAIVFEREMNNLKNYLSNCGFIDSSVQIYADEFR